MHFGYSVGHTPSKPALVARNDRSQELQLYTVKGAHGGHGVGVGVHLDLSCITLSAAALVSQFLETQLRNQSVKFLKNLSLISFEMQTEMFDRAWLRCV